VLTGTAETQRLEIVGSVKENYRAPYDILVRPKGSVTAIERETGMVRVAVTICTTGRAGT
jgi:putative ABC transport system permease protein